jgi:AraC family transcriptional regulator
MIVKRTAGAFYGQVQRCHESAGVTFVECVYTVPSRVHLPWHVHENAYLYLVVAGACEERLGSTTRVVDSSALVFHPVGEPHSNRWADPGGRAFHVEFSQSRIAAISDYATVRRDPAEIRCGQATWLAARLYREYKNSDDLSPLVMEGLALEILAEISRPDTPDAARTPPRWLSQARGILHDRLAEPLLQADVATAVGVHPVHLARSFRHHFGCTLGEYLRRLRVESACHRLATTETPLCEIALATGFADQSHFTRTFRRLMRMTPGEYRRNFRQR